MINAGMFSSAIVIFARSYLLETERREDAMQEEAFQEWWARLLTGDKAPELILEIVAKEAFKAGWAASRGVVWPHGD